MTTVQHRIADGRETLEVRVTPELEGYWRVAYRYVLPGLGHRDDWREAEHLTPGEVEDVVAVVVDTWMDDVRPPF